MARKLIMRDVAELAGVSTMTVSRVLAGPGRVAEDKRRRVVEAIDKLGYVPDRIAGSLSSQRSGIIGVVLPTLNSFNFADTARGLTAALRGDGYQLLIGYTEYELAEEERLVRALLARRPEAMVVTGGNHSKPTRQMLLAAGIPVVEIWDLPPKPVDRAVGFSNFAVGQAMTRHLIAAGYRRIAFLAPPQLNGFRDFRGEDRLGGYRAALSEAGLPDDLFLRHGHGTVDFSHGAEALAAALDGGLDFDAVFAVSDLSAVGALMECQRRGIRVPDQLGIAGFGDFEIGSQVVPSLTTVHVQCEGIGERAGKLLLEILQSDDQDDGAWHAPIDLGFTVVARDSTLHPKAERASGS